MPPDEAREGEHARVVQYEVVQRKSIDLATGREVIETLERSDPRTVETQESPVRDRHYRSGTSRVRTDSSGRVSVRTSRRRRRRAQRANANEAARRAMGAPRR